MPHLESDHDLLPLPGRLRADITVLATVIGRRSVWYPEGLQQSVDFLQEELRKVRLEPNRQSFHVRGVDCHNIEVEIFGASRPEEIIIVGAHYDSVDDSPAANDNGSGVAATLALARHFAGSRPERTLRFVFFVNEEPPFFMTDEMGSLIYARRCRGRGEEIRAMFSLETIGYFNDRPGSQSYPLGLLDKIYPDRGNFIAFVSNLRSRKLMKDALKTFEDHGSIPVEGAALPGFIPGVGWSDHWSFWEQGYPAVMVTDTAPFRYPYYHTTEDTPEKLDYDRMSLVVEGLTHVVTRLANPKKG